MMSASTSGAASISVDVWEWIDVFSVSEELERLLSPNSLSSAELLLLVSSSESLVVETPGC
jgi:hypothetical protein